MYLFTSERLGFRTWQAEDLQPFAQLNADPEVMEYFPHPYTLQETEQSILRFNKHFDTHNVCFWAVDILETGEFIGFIGMVYQEFEADFTPCHEIGWRLKRASWGQGYATEGAKRCLAYAFQDLKLPAIYSFTATLNTRSERVMQKIGMHKVGEFEHPKLAEGHRLRTHVLYKIDQSTST